MSDIVINEVIHQNLKRRFNIHINQNIHSD